MVAAAVIGGAVIGGVASNMASSDAAQTAADAQTSSTNASIAAQTAQFNAMKELLKPYADAGLGALPPKKTCWGSMAPTPNPKPCKVSKALHNSRRWRSKGKMPCSRMRRPRVGYAGVISKGRWRNIGPPSWLK